MSASPSDCTSGLPPLWAGKRRGQLSILVGAGLGQATAAGLGAHFVIHLLRGGASSHQILLFGILVVSALVVGALRMVERVISEVLSQNYVHEIRVGLIRRNLADGRVRNLGVAVARTTNDLGSVQSWISQGVTPLAVGIPLILGAGIAMLLIDPVLTITLFPPLALLLIGLRWVTPTAYARTRALRKARGKLAGQVADTILSSRAIRSGGGVSRELKRVEQYSTSLVAAATRRARSAGALRGMAAASSGLTTASAVGIGLAVGMPASHVAAALTVTGLLSAPIQDLGRAAEFRQTYRAARRIIGPAVDRAPAGVGPTPPGRRRGDGIESRPTVPPDVAEESSAVLVVESMQYDGDRDMPTLTAFRGDRVLVRTGDRRADSVVLDQLAGIAGVGRARIRLDGVDLTDASPGRRRRLVGYGCQGMLHARTTVRRAVGYRSPTPPGDEVLPLLAAVGLQDTVARLPGQLETLLQHGGEPLTIPERARLTLARALYNEPPLLVFDHLDADLGRAGRATMRDLLRSYPGVVVLTTDAPDDVVDVSVVWETAAVTRTSIVGDVTVRDITEARR